MFSPATAVWGGHGGWRDHDSLPIAGGMNIKLDFSQVFERTIDVYKAHFKTLIMAGLAIFGVVFILSVLLLMAVFSGNAGGAIFGVLVFACLAIVANFFYTGMVIRVVQYHGDGREHSVGELFESVKPVIVPLIFTGILAGLFIGLGFVALIVPGLFVMTHLAVVAAVVVVERISYIDAMKRSWEMVKGNAWTVFAILIVMMIVLGIARSILGAVGSGAGNEVGQALMQLVANVFLGPFLAIAAAVMYFSLGGSTAPATSTPGAPPTPTPGATPPATPGTAPSIAGSKPPPPPDS